MTIGLLTSAGSAPLPAGQLSRWPGDLSSPHWCDRGGNPGPGHPQPVRDRRPRPPTGLLAPLAVPRDDVREGSGLGQERRAPASRPADGARTVMVRMAGRMLAPSSTAAHHRERHADTRTTPLINRRWQRLPRLPAGPSRVGGEGERRRRVRAAPGRGRGRRSRPGGGCRAWRTGGACGSSRC
jgi:hypothetical protein